MADIGVWMAPSVLEHKLEDGERERTETTWNVGRLPRRLIDEAPPHRLFVASAGCWCGYFRLLPEVLYNPDDERAPYALIFDAASWVEIPPVPVKRFRGFRYEVPAIAPTPAGRVTDRFQRAVEGILAARERRQRATQVAQDNDGDPPVTEGDPRATSPGPPKPRRPDRPRA